MRDEHDGEFVAAVDLRDGLVEILFAGRVHAGGGFVEEQEVGLFQQREDDEHALKLAAGERGDGAVQQ